MKIICDPKGFVGKVGIPDVGEFEAGVHEVADHIGELLLKNHHFRAADPEPTPAPASAAKPAKADTSA